MQNIATLTLSLLPLSLISLYLLEKFVFKHKAENGKTDVICTNITGNLTKNQLMVRTIYYDQFKITKEDRDNFLRLENIKSKEELLLEMTGLSKDENLILIATVVTLSRYSKLETIEKTILDFFLQGGINKQKISNEYRVLEKIPSNDNKKLSTVVAQKNKTKEIFSFSKGHARTLLDRCDRIQVDDKKNDLTHQSRRKIRKQIDKLNANGQKVIACAYKPLPIKKLSHYTAEFTENDLVFLGLIGVTEPLNLEIAAHVEKGKAAGIKTYILSQGKERKAIAISKQLKIINPSYFECITGPYLKQLSDQKLHKMLSNKDKDFVFAELNEEDIDRVKTVLEEENSKVAQCSKKTTTNYQQTIDNIEKGRIIHHNFHATIQHAIVFKIAQITLILAALIFRAPLPFSIASILILEIFINLMLELSIRNKTPLQPVMTKDFANRKTTFKWSHQMIKGLTIGAILSILFLLTLTQNGWSPGDTVQKDFTIFSIAITTNIILLAAVQIYRSINSYDPQKTIFRMRFLNEIQLTLTAILVIFGTYLITKYSVFSKNIDLNNIDQFNWQIMLYGLFILFSAVEISKIFRLKNPKK